MSKAVLVMDMPDGCAGCHLYDYPSSRCYVTEKYQNDISKDYKPDWCPLVPLPEKKESDPVMDHDIDFGMAEGWNACIDAITGNSQP